MLNDTKYVKAFTRAKTLHWESDYFCEGSKASSRREAKRIMKRARRRFARMIIEAQLQN